MTILASNAIKNCFFTKKIIFMLANYFNELVSALFEKKDVNRVIHIYKNYIGRKYITLFLVYYLLTGIRVFYQIYKLIIFENYDKTDDKLRLLFSLAIKKIEQQHIQKPEIKIIDEIVYYIHKNINNININKVTEDYSLLKSYDDFIELKDVYFLHLLNIDANTYIDLLSQENLKQIETIKFNSGIIQL